jgi:hypothetical protein
MTYAKTTGLIRRSIFEEDVPLSSTKSSFSSEEEKLSTLKTHSSQLNKNFKAS